RRGGRPGRLARAAGRGRAGHVGLEVSAAGARSLAGNPVELDHHVPELRPAAVELAVEDDAAAAPRSECEHHHRLHVASGARVKLAVGGRVRIVLDTDGNREAVLHARAEVESLARDVHGSFDPARPLIETRRDPEAEADDGAVHELFYGSVKAGEERVLRLGGRRRLAAMLDGAVSVDDAGQDLRPAKVDADDARVRQGCWLP